MAGALHDKLMALIEPLLTTLGYELADLEFAAGRGHSQLRVYIDRPGGVGLDDCETCSREIGALLDVHDPIPSAYTLELSSPGLDRLVRTPAQFLRFVGTKVAIELLAPRDGRRRYSGQLLGADAQGVEVEVDGEQVAARYVEILRARLVPEWPDNSSRGRRR